MEALKARMESSAISNATMNSQFAESREKIDVLETEKSLLVSKMASKDREIDDLYEEIRKLKRQLENERTEKESNFDRMKSKFQNELDEVSAHRDRLASELGQVKMDLQTTNEQLEALKV